MLGIHHLDLRTAVVLLRQQVLHFLEIPEQIVVVLRLQMLMLVAHLGRISRPGALQLVKRNFLQDILRESVLQDVRVVQHHPDTHALAILE